MDDKYGSLLVKWLSGVDAYPHRPLSVEHIETHISHVFLAGELVYKLKKPVRFDFLDYSNLAAREQACRDELRLNRRLAAEAYLQVLPITLAKGSRFEFAGPGELVDWVVQMRRLPTERSLAALIDQGEASPAHIAMLSNILTKFYQSQRSSPISATEYVDRVRAHVVANARELHTASRDLSIDLIDRVHHFQLQSLTFHEDLFADRVAAGRIVDGHGDLRPEHICFTQDGSVLIFDCLEFSADLRRIDCLDELAFLAAECDFLGARWIGPLVREAYAAGCRDRAEDRLWSFCRSYRAVVRAKIAALRAAQLDDSHRQASISEAQQHLQLADEYAEPWRSPQVLIVGGLSGTGKSTLASAIAERLGARMLRTDVLRKQIFGNRPVGERGENELYGAESRQLIYTRMFEQAQHSLAAGISVVLDGTFGQRLAIQDVQDLARRQGCSLLGIECTCPAEVARARIAERLAHGDDASDARPEIHDLQHSQWQPWPATLAQVQIDTQMPLPQQLRLALRQINPH